MAVTLVGAGPGDAGLLTIKGREKLAEAEVVLFDRLVGDEILELIPQTAEKINVGKHVNDHPVPQGEKSGSSKGRRPLCVWTRGGRIRTISSS